MDDYANAAYGSAMQTPPEVLARIRSGAADHLARYLESDGEEGYIYKGAPILILTTTGRRSGEPRSAPLIFGRDADAFVVIASLGGSDNDPGWYRNLAANPDAQVQVRKHRFSVRARIAEGDERARLWGLMVEIYPSYLEYQSRTQREIPVIRLEPH